MAQTNGTKLPLSDVVVLDLTLARAGPTCSRHLADWGANVIRIEPPQPAGEDVVGRRHGTDFQNLHRNKRAIQLDLKSPDGYAVFKKLVERADVVVENMRPPVKGRLKITYEELKAINPKIVMGSISGFGQDGPYATKGGVDQIAQGMGGLMSITGIPGQGPVRVGIPINDLVAGSLLALSIMMALFDRTRTGEGRWVYTSLLETQIFLLDFQGSRYLMKGEVAGQTGNDHPTMTPSGVFPTSDGYINLAASSGRLYERLCDVCEKPEWKTHPQFSKVTDRTANRAAFNAALGDVLKHKPTAHWVEKFDEAGIPAGPINTIDKVFADPQVQHLGMAAPLTSPIFGDTKVVGSPLNFSGVKKKIRNPTPEAGAHTAEVLQWLGYAQSEIDRMRGIGAI
ncbi:MAG TPA: CoA transferase [Burkholderiales bacterium]|jgi:crotonobetainyl-CoA:carnitine CoA-transferase CaiB-like acyl-CoA transferase|nr:CoA transferase [Burkholderiales bacterium]